MSLQYSSQTSSHDDADAQMCSLPEGGVSQPYGNAAAQDPISSEPPPTDLGILDIIPKILGPMGDGLEESTRTGDPMTKAMGEQGKGTLGVLGNLLGFGVDIYKAVTEKDDLKSAYYGGKGAVDGMALFGGLRQLATGNESLLGKAAGGVGGLLGVAEGVHDAWNADSAADAAAGGVALGASGASAVGGLAASGSSLAALGPVGMAMGAGLAAFGGTWALLENTVGKSDNRAKTVDEEDQYDGFGTVDGYDPDSWASRFNAWTTDDAYEMRDADEVEAEANAWYKEPAHAINKLIDEPWFD